MARLLQRSRHAKYDRDVPLAHSLTRRWLRKAEVSTVALGGTTSGGLPMPQGVVCRSRVPAEAPVTSAGRPAPRWPRRRRDVAWPGIIIVAGPGSLPHRGGVPSRRRSSNASACSGSAGEARTDAGGAGPRLAEAFGPYDVEMVGARGPEPAVPTPRIVLPEWITNALRSAAYVVGPKGLAPTQRRQFC